MDSRTLRTLGTLGALYALASPDDVSFEKLKASFREAVQRDPIDARVSLVVGAAYLFYEAEKGQNPKVESYADALVFISTCLSVGYADVFARTPAGKLIATFVM